MAYQPDLERLRELVSEGYLTEQVHPLGGLSIFNYTQKAQWERAWNDDTRHCRGLIVAHDGRVIARSFPKFFNYGEEMPAPDARIVEVSEKMDGSLGILYGWQEQPWIATRGAFTSPQAQWATAYFRTHIPPTAFHPDYTLLFEIIYPGNRVVVNYGEREGLCLLAAIETATGRELPADVLDDIAAYDNYSRPMWYPTRTFEDLLEAAKQISANEEGWVVKMSDGSRFKVKGEAYKIAHRLMTGVTFGRVLEAVTSGQYDAMIEGVPDEFLGAVKAWKDEIEQVVWGDTQYVTDALADYVREFGPVTDRKAFALWVQARVPKGLQGLMFAALDGKPLRPLVLKSAFRERAASAQ